MSNWQTVKLGDCTEIARGSSPRPINDNAYFDKGTIPWIKIADATASFKYIYETKEYVNEYGASFSRKLPAGSLIVAASGTLGFAIFLGVEGCVHDGWMYFKRIDEGRLNKQFLYYLLNTLTKSFNAFSYGAAIQNINTDILRNTGFRIPTLNVQKNIAAILAAYDELIENNQRRIALLEKMAEGIYREWFVRLRFPGHEKVKIVKGVPEGWERTKIHKATSYLSRGVAPLYNDSADGIAINQKCIRDGKLDVSLARRQSRNVASVRYVQIGDVLVNSTGEGTLGRVAQVLTPISNCLVDSHVTIVRPKAGVSAHYFGMTLKGWETHFSTMGRGATNQTELSPTVIGEIEMLMPPKALQEQFELYAAPIFSQLTNLSDQNICLVKARNALLPRLISGKLSVENLDIQFPPSMEEAAHAA